MIDKNIGKTERIIDTILSRENEFVEALFNEYVTIKIFNIGSLEQLIGMGNGVYIKPFDYFMNIFGNEEKISRYSKVPFIY
jgi:hypothetical protein